MSKITHDGLTRSGRGCFIALYPYGNIGRQRVKVIRKGEEGSVEKRKGKPLHEDTCWHRSITITVTVSQPDRAMNKTIIEASGVIQTSLVCVLR